jgi:MFS family permease
MLRFLRRYFAGLSRNTFLLAFASLFADISTEMLYPILPVFLTETLGASGSVVGIVEGMAVAVQYIWQGVAGWLADKFQRPKPMALAGYIVAALSKSLIGLSSTWQAVLGARSLDRFATGTRSAPRDAMVAASANAEHRGKAFGLEGIGDNLGACLGPLIAIALVSGFGFNLRSIFLLAIIPGLLAAAMILFLRDQSLRVSAKATLDMNVSRFPAAYWRYLAVTAVFGAGNSSNSFLILRTKDLGASLATTVLIYAFFNFVAAVTSFPAGFLSDRLGRKRILLAAFAVFLIVYLGFSSVSNIVLIAALFILYGVFEAAYRAVGKALAADFVPADLRASSVGWYSATVGLSGLVASLVGGQLWTHVSPASTFLFGAVMSGIGIIAALILISRRSG